MKKICFGTAGKAWKGGLEKCVKSREKCGPHIPILSLYVSAPPPPGVGPPTEPRGTTQVTGMRTIWKWKVRYYLNHSSAWPWTPRDASSFNIILWSTVTNAEYRFNNTMAVIFPASISCNMKLDTFKAVRRGGGGGGGWAGGQLPPRNFQREKNTLRFFFSNSFIS